MLVDRFLDTLWYFLPSVVPTESVSTLTFQMLLCGFTIQLSLTTVCGSVYVLVYANFSHFGGRLDKPFVVIQKLHCDN